MFALPVNPFTWAGTWGSEEREVCTPLSPYSGRGWRHRSFCLSGQISACLMEPLM